MHGHVTVTGLLADGYGLGKGLGRGLKIAAYMQHGAQHRCHKGARLQVILRQEFQRFASEFCSTRHVSPELCNVGPNSGDVTCYVA
jgi:hypothetical protein